MRSRWPQLLPRAWRGPAGTRRLHVVSRPEEAPAARGRPPALIGTHSGAFHCDEALACAMLTALPEYASAVVVRSRDPAVLEACDVLVDIGATYDPERRRYDHHQRGFTDVMSELGHTTKLSSAGLVYRHYGARVLAKLAEDCRSKDPDAGTSALPLDFDALYSRVYRRFVEHVDGIDNGVDSHDGSRNYEVSTTLSDRVAALNPRWNEPSGPEEVNRRFGEAVELTGKELKAVVAGLVNSWWPARALVMTALEGADRLHASRQILELKQACPWGAHLLQLEAERADAGDRGVVGAAKYVIFPDAGSATWRIQAVPAQEDSFASRRALPEAWRGVRDGALAELTGVPDSIFVHASGFIGGATSREGALTMALKAIEAR